jgi:hypothetical protein
LLIVGVNHLGISTFIVRISLRFSTFIITRRTGGFSTLIVILEDIVSVDLQLIDVGIDRHIVDGHVS